MNNVYFLLGLCDALLGILYLLAGYTHRGWCFLALAFMLSLGIKNEEPESGKNDKEDVDL